MKISTEPIIGQFYREKIGKTAIETALGTAWANGDTTNNGALLVNIVVNEVGDKFIANKDSDKGYYKKGESVTRKAQSIEFKSFGGNNAATQFAQGAKAFGLQLVVQMA